MSLIQDTILSIFQSINRKLFKSNWKDFRSVHPISRNFGVDRGTPIDRFYIEKFLYDNRDYIKNTVLEIADSYYSNKFHSGEYKQEILHFTNDNPNATIIGDLTKLETLKPEIADCFICTQTLNFIYDVKAAIKGIHYSLKKGGIALVTVSGLSQISRYDMDRWGDYWRFTDKSIKLLFSEVFSQENITINTFGNALSTTAFLQGISAEELNNKELSFVDNNYQLILTVVARKNN